MVKNIPCQHVLKSGKNKGDLCNKNCKIGSDCCGASPKKLRLKSFPELDGETDKRYFVRLEGEFGKRKTGENLETYIRLIKRRLTASESMNPLRERAALLRAPRASMGGGARSRTRRRPKKAMRSRRR